MRTTLETSEDEHTQVMKNIYSNYSHCLTLILILVRDRKSSKVPEYNYGLKLHSKRVQLPSATLWVTFSLITTGTPCISIRPLFLKITTSPDLDYTQHEWRWKLHSKRVKMRTTLKTSEDQNYTQNEWRSELHSKPVKIRTRLKTSEYENYTRKEWKKFILPEPNC
jgi:hypothetical protein